MEKVSTPVPAVAAVTTSKLRQIAERPQKITRLSGGAACGGCLIPIKVTSTKEVNNNLPPISTTDEPSYPTKALEKNVNYPNHRLIQSDPRMLKKKIQPTMPGSMFFPEKRNEQQQNRNKVPAITLSKKSDNLLPNKVQLFQNNLKQNKLFHSLDITRKPNENNFNKNYQFMKMNVSDLMAILYKFNYTLTYHGHSEIGRRDGDKNGSYFIKGRDGYERNVKYIANEFGYQPNITLSELNINETPREETEKLLTKLFGNEFIWYY